MPNAAAPSQPPTTSSKKQRTAKKKKCAAPAKTPKVIVFAAKRRRNLRVHLAPSPWWQEQLRSKRLRKMPPPADHTPMQACVSPDQSHKTCGRVYPLNYGISVLRPSPLAGVDRAGFVCEDCRQEKILADRQRLAKLEVTGGAQTENLLSTGHPDPSSEGECADLLRRQMVITELRSQGFTDREIAVGSRVLEGCSYRRVAELTGIRKTRVGVVFGSFRARCDRLGIQFDDMRKKQPAPEVIYTDPSALDRHAAPAA